MPGSNNTTTPPGIHFVFFTRTSSILLATLFTFAFYVCTKRLKTMGTPFFHSCFYWDEFWMRALCTLVFFFLSERVLNRNTFQCIFSFFFSLSLFLLHNCDGKSRCGRSLSCSTSRWFLQNTAPFLVSLFGFRRLGTVSYTHLTLPTKA